MVIQSFQRAVRRTSSQWEQALVRRAVFLEVLQLFQKHSLINMTFTQLTQPVNSVPYFRFLTLPKMTMGGVYVRLVALRQPTNVAFSPRSTWVIFTVHLHFLFERRFFFWAVLRRCSFIHV